MDFAQRLPMDVMRGLRVMSATSRTLWAEARTAALQEQRVQEIAMLGDVMDGHLRPSGDAAEGDFAPWEWAMQEASSAMRHGTDVLTELAATATAAFALAAGRCVAVVEGGGEPSMADLWWAHRTGAGGSRLAGALAEIEPPEALWSARERHAEAVTALAKLADAAAEEDVADWNGTICAYGREYGHESAEYCYRALADFADAAYDRLCDVHHDRDVQGCVPQVRGGR